MSVKRKVKKRVLRNLELAESRAYWAEADKRYRARLGWLAWKRAGFAPKPEPGEWP